MRWLRRKKPEKDPTSIGNLLLAAGIVHDAHIEEALQYQKEHRDMLIGEALVHMGIILREELEVAVVKQKAMRTGKISDVRALVDLAAARTKEATKTITVATDKIAAITRTKNVT